MSLMEVRRVGGRATLGFLLLIFSAVASSEGDGRPDAEIMVKTQTPLGISSSPSPPSLNDSDGFNNQGGEEVSSNGRRRPFHHHHSNNRSTRPTKTDHQEPSRKLRCACDSPDCLRNHKNFCITSGICYKQYLDRGGKAPHFIKGCTDDPTPLLCENRPPTPRNSHRWPYLECCNSDFCNMNLIMTIPAHLGAVIHEVNMTKGKATGGRHDKGISQATTIGPDTNWQRKQTALNNKNSFPPISLLATSFLVGAACVIILISSIGFYILRREQSLANIHYRKDLSTPLERVEGGRIEQDETNGGNEGDFEDPMTNNLTNNRLKNTNKVSSINQLENQEDFPPLPSSHHLSASTALFTQHSSLSSSPVTI